MKILALAMLLAVMQASPPVPRKAADSPAHTSSAIQQQTDNKNPNAADAATMPDANQSPKHDAARNNQDRNDIERDISVTKLPTVSVEPDWGMYLFSGLLVIVGVLQVWLLYRTWGQIQRQAGIMERQTVLMERQINKERARIRIELKHLKLMQPDPGEEETVQTIEYTVTFYGFTYAFIEEDVFEAYLSDSTDVGDGQVRGVLGGNPSTVFLPGTPPADRMEPIGTTRFEVDSLMHGKSFIHFRGRIKYRDFAEIDRETTICCVWKSFGPRKGKPPSILGGSGRWEKSGPPEGNHET